MAIEEQPRENLMRDAVAYSTRLLLHRANEQPPIFWGMRPDSSWSLYFGEDPVFQFNARSELRRAYVGHQRMAARDGKLYLLLREPALGRVEMAWRYQPEIELETLDHCQHHLLQLKNELLSDLLQVMEAVAPTAKLSEGSAEPNVVSLLTNRLASMPWPIVIAVHPHSQS